MQENKDGREEHWTMVLADGTQVQVREIQPEDAPALQRLVGRLSEQTIHLRFSAQWMSSPIRKLGTLPR